MTPNPYRAERHRGNWVAGTQWWTDATVDGPYLGRDRPDRWRFVLATLREETCIPDVVIAGISIPGRFGLDKRWSKRTGAVGLGMSTAGVLLATIWSDVPVARRATVAITPGGLPVGTSFAW